MSSKSSPPVTLWEKHTEVTARRPCRPRRLLCHHRGLQLLHVTAAPRRPRPPAPGTEASGLPSPRRAWGHLPFQSSTPLCDFGAQWSQGPAWRGSTEARRRPLPRRPGLRRPAVPSSDPRWPSFLCPGLGTGLALLKGGRAWAAPPTPRGPGRVGQCARHAPRSAGPTAGKGAAIRVPLCRWGRPRLRAGSPPGAAGRAVPVCALVPATAYVHARVCGEEFRSSREKELCFSAHRAHRLGPAGPEPRPRTAATGPGSAQLQGYQTLRRPRSGLDSLRAPVSTGGSSLC